MTKQQLFDSITAKIKDKLDSGILPWRKGWQSGMPMNYISKRPYNGINFLSLILNDYSSPFYLTYLQCKDKKGFVNKGANGIPVVFWKIKEYKVAENSEAPDLKSFPLVRVSYVFNLSQTSLFKHDIHEPVIQDCEKIILDMKVKPLIKNNISRCYYNPADDYISIPSINNFESPDEYYSSLFHELIHWTGHNNRLNRNLSIKDKEHNAFEELIAELGSSYLCGLCNLQPSVLDNQASYIQSWIKLISSEKGALIKAVAEAKKAVDLILNGSVLPSNNEK